MKLRALGVATILAGCALAAACSDDFATGDAESAAGAAGDTTVCVPGHIRSCTGPGDCPGTQQCHDDGRGYGPCQCVGGSGGSSAAGSGPGGTGGATGGTGGDTGGTGGATGGTAGEIGTGGATGGTAGEIGTGGATGGTAGETGGSGGSTGGSPGEIGGSPGTGGSTGGTGGSTGGTGGSTGGTGGATGGTGGSTGGTGGSIGGTGGDTGGTGGSTGGTGGVVPIGGTGGSTGGTGGTGGSTGGTAGSAGCPDSSAYVGDPTWDNSLEVTSDAVYCSTFREGRTLEQDLAAKAKMSIAPGSYPIPRQDGTYEFALPVCFEMPPGVDTPYISGSGEIRLSTSVWDTTRSYNNTINQPLDSDLGGQWSFQGSIYFSSDVNSSPPPYLLDGSEPTDPFGGESFYFQLCQGAECYQYDDITFAACNPTSYQLDRHTVTFDGGQIILDVRKGMSMAGTEPGAFVRASGTLDGVLFNQQDYWKLIYAPTHHHFSRDFAVLFDTPIGSACGMKVVAVEPWDNPTLPEVYLIDCALKELESRTVTSERFENP